MSQLGSITAEKEKQMDLERQRFQEVKAKMLAQQKYKRAARTAGHIVLNIVVALIVLLPLLYAVSIAFMPSGELFYSGYEYPAQTSDIGEFPTGTAEGSAGSFCSKLFPGSRSHHFRTDHFLFTGSVFLFLSGFQRKKCAVYAGDGNYDDSGRGNDYFQLPDSQRMELAGFLSGTDRALSHICNGNLPVQTVLSYISDFAV